MTWIYIVHIYGARWRLCQGFLPGSLGGGLGPGGWDGSPERLTCMTQEPNTRALVIVLLQIFQDARYFKSLQDNILQDTSRYFTRFSSHFKNCKMFQHNSRCFNIGKYVSRCFKIFQDVSIIFKMLQDNLNIFHAISSRFNIFQYTSRCFKTSKIFQVTSRYFK